MNVCVRNTFVSLWLFFGAASLSAQGASFYFPFINNATAGSNKLMPLRAVNLDSVVALQLVVRWDPTVLRYITVENFGLANLTLADFNTTHALDSGYVRLQWEGPTTLPPGTSLADSAIVFRMRFNLIGPDSSCSPVRITEILDFPPLNFEVVKVQPDTSNLAYTLADCPRTNGFICIGTTSSAQENTDFQMPLSCAPNPFSVSTRLEYFLDETTDVQVVISDVSGRIVFEKNFFNLPPGQHGMVIENGMLGAPGVYALTLQAGRKIATRTLVLL